MCIYSFNWKTIMSLLMSPNVKVEEEGKKEKIKNNNHYHYYFYSFFIIFSSSSLFTKSAKNNNIKDNNLYWLFSEFNLCVPDYYYHHQLIALKAIQDHCKAKIKKEINLQN